MTAKKFHLYISIQLSGNSRPYDKESIVRGSNGELTMDDVAEIQLNYDKYLREFTGNYLGKTLGNQQK